KVCTYLSEVNINILDISQTIIGGYFNMMMIVDITEATKKIEEVNEELLKIGTKMGVIITTQHEDIFNCMHRV
ncbi:MAG TPA: ACT domain-containing protein, partial [Fusobacterium sp.]|uniref:ACT domain-containing protein n=1 Tax=Fusobacterium sp. TaxID=68766 RepID=UPI002F3E3B59